MHRVFQRGLFGAFLGIVCWSAVGAAESSKSEPAPADPAALAARVKEILRTRCFECHGGTSTQSGVQVLDHKSMLAKKTVVPGKPDESPLYRAVIQSEEDARMPQGLPPLPQSEIDAIRNWILVSAPVFPDDVTRPTENDKDAALRDVVGIDYVLKQILAHQRKLSLEDRRHMRYFSCNHLLARGATREELQMQRDALAKAINHLSRESLLVRPEVIDGETASVFAADIRKLGWHKQPYKAVEGERATANTTNLFDLVLLEYPYGIAYEDSETYDTLVLEYLQPAKLVRPIPYVRTDWFCSVATQPPLYHDLLQLPHDLESLEKDLAVDPADNLKTGRAQRAGMIVSGVSRNNRAVERHPAPHGFYWKSIDYATSKGRDNLFTDPVNLEGAGGEMIFTLPNGMQAYYLATGKGVRLDSAPTEIVTDKFSEDKVVRNGLACIRCHDRGMKDFHDDVRRAVELMPGSAGMNKREILALYPVQKDMDALLERDRKKFLDSVEQLLGKPQTQEPLIPVTQRFIDAPLQLSTAAGELGLADSADLKSMFRRPQFAALGLLPLSGAGAVRRDMWEDYYDQIVRGLGVGIPIIAMDGLTRRDYQPVGGGLKVDLTTTKKNNVFAPGDELAITVTNQGKSPIFIELIGTGTNGEKAVLVKAKTIVEPGKQHRFPERGAIKVQPALGKELITLYASESEFPGGVVLRGTNVADRVIHPFYETKAEGRGAVVSFDAAKVSKRTLEIETR